MTNLSVGKTKGVPANYRCQCGGIMENKPRQNMATQALENWLVCPFCQTQRPTQPHGFVAQADDAEERVLTQAR